MRRLHRNLIRILKQNKSELVRNRYDNGHPLGGLCYIASEALFHLQGGLTPYQLTHEGVSHWWLQTKEDYVIDLTRTQFSFKFPYSLGRAKGFLTKHPSKRTQVVLEKLMKVDAILRIGDEDYPVGENKGVDHAITKKDLDLLIKNGLAEFDEKLGIYVGSDGLGMLMKLGG